MPELNLWLIRHGESTANVGACHDPELSVLTNKGHQQANELISKISVVPDLIVVSPLIRTHETVRPIQNKWPELPLEVWPIQEFLYIDPVKYQQLSTQDRMHTIDNYWQNCDPFFCDSDKAESFVDFVKRLENFHQCLLKKSGFVIVIGHGQFLKAYQLALQQGFKVDKKWMQSFRAIETAQPLLNCEIVRLNLSLS